MSAQLPAPPGSPQRPVDVDTAFWLWIISVPLLVIGQVSDALHAQTPDAAGSKTALVAVTTFFVLAVAAVVLTFTVLLRSGYRWARTLLTAGGVGTIVYTALSLLGAPREPVPAVIFAVTGIIGSVLIGGGIVLLHRADANRFFIK